MRSELDCLKIAVPKDVYQKIIGFCDDKLAAIVYEPDRVFAECYTDEIGSVREDGVFEISGEEELYQCLGAFCSTLLQMEEELDQFAMCELAPLLGDQKRE